MYISKFLLVIISLHICHGNFETLLLLTPNEDLQIQGKKMYYPAGRNETIGSIPWEQALKHVTYLTLFKIDESYGKIKDIGAYKQFMQSPYSRITNDYPNFGDITTIAQGWLEKTNKYNFVEGVCNITCSERALALWNVQRIRHRDMQRGFRYEMKFSVNPLKESSTIQNKNICKGQYIKSYILKDDDYPENFNVLKRKSDYFKILSNEKPEEIINESPSILPLNIREYFYNVQRASSKIEYQTKANDSYVTTYRPTYHIKFSKPETIEQISDSPKTLISHHFHHHFFMNHPRTRLFQESTALLRNSDGLYIINDPKTNILGSQYTKFLPTTTTATSPEIPSYLHTIPIFKHTLDQKEASTKSKFIPFKTSEQQTKRIRYSDPDPLYENKGLGAIRTNFETITPEIQPQVERTQNGAEPQVIKLKLPQAGGSNYTEFVFVGKSNVSTTTKPTTEPTKKFIEIKTFNIMPTQNSSLHISKLSITKLRTFSQSTTEQPVLKWKPKSELVEKRPELESSENDQQDFTITPSSVYRMNQKFLTKKSVRKSISVKIGNYSHDIQMTDVHQTNRKN